jgi:hypothetical protein
MPKYGPASAFLIVGGRVISTEVYNLDTSIESTLEECHGLSETMERSLPVGVGKATLDAKGGVYDDKALGLWEALLGNTGSLQIVAWGYGGMTVGQQMLMANGIYGAQVNRISERTGLTKMNAKFTVSGAVGEGQIVSDLTSRGTASNTQATPADRHTQENVPAIPITNATVAASSVITSPNHGLVSTDVIWITGSTTTPTIDGERIVTVSDGNTFTVPVNVTSNGGAQANCSFQKMNSAGAIFDVHVPALVLGGYTNISIQPMHSADNGAWVSVGSAMTFTAAGTAQRQTIAVGTNVRRYTAMAWAWTGAGSGMSAQVFVGVSR